MKTRMVRPLVALALFSTLNLQPLTAHAQSATVFPIATNTHAIEFLGGIASSSTNYLVGFNQNDTNVCVQLVSSNGALLGLPLTNGASKGEPRIAFGKTNYLVMWGDDYLQPQPQLDLFGQIVSPGGVKVGSAFPLLSTLGSHGFQAERAIDFDGANFLCVWEDDNGNPTSAFYGQLVTPSGTLLGSEFLIANGQYEDEDTALAFGATNSLFAWQTGNSPCITYGAFISRSGSIGGAFPISQTSSPSHNPLAIGFDGSNYLVVWDRDTGPGYPNPPIWQLDARFVSPNGNLIGSEFTLVTNQALFPSLAFDGANYLLAWSYNLDTTNSNKTMFFRFFDRSANPVGAAFNIFQPQGTNSPLFGDVIFDGSRFFAADVSGAVGVDSTGGLTNIFSASIFGAFIPKSTPPPQLTPLNYTNGQFSLLLTGTDGTNYII